MEDRQREKPSMLIGVLEADKENNGTELISKTIIQEQVLEANEDISFHSERFRR